MLSADESLLLFKNVRLSDSCSAYLSTRYGQAVLVVLPVVNELWALRKNVVFPCETLQVTPGKVRVAIKSALSPLFDEASLHILDQEHKQSAETEEVTYMSDEMFLPLKMLRSDER